MHRRRRTALLLTAAIAAAAPLLTACGSDSHPGAAAVVGGQRITVAQLENRVNEVRTAQRTAVANDAVPPPHRFHPSACAAARRTAAGDTPATHTG